MESSTDVLYDIKMNVSAGNKNAGGFLGYDTSRNSVTVNLTGSYNQGDLAHELKHGHQFLEGKISLYSVSGRSYGGDLYDVQDEVEAYNRGHFFGSINSSVSQIQKNYPSLKGKLTQRTLQNTSVTPTVTKKFIISGVKTPLLTVPHHYYKK